MTPGAAAQCTASIMEPRALRLQPSGDLQSVLQRPVAGQLENRSQLLGKGQKAGSMLIKMGSGQDVCAELTGTGPALHD